jgi:hypothetical protein
MSFPSRTDIMGLEDFDPRLREPVGTIFAADKDTTT